MATLLQTWTFLEALVNLWNKSSGRFAPLEIVKQRFAICAECEHFTGKYCKICGCCTNTKGKLFNKLAYPLEECPDGRWFAYKKPLSKHDLSSGTNDNNIKAPPE